MGWYINAEELLRIHLIPLDDGALPRFKHRFGVIKRRNKIVAIRLGKQGRPYKDWYFIGFTFAFLAFLSFYSSWIEVEYLTVFESPTSFIRADSWNSRKAIFAFRSSISFDGFWPPFFIILIISLSVLLIPLHCCHFPYSELVLILPFHSMSMMGILRFIVLLCPPYSFGMKRSMRFHGLR